jgi:hypothetical protein
VEQLGLTGGHLFASYREHRTAIGILGILLPFLLGVGGLLTHQGLQSSISVYYHTGMRDVLVGTFWAIGFFLLGYVGYDACDNWAGNVGFVFAVGTSLFPTDVDGVWPPTVRGTIHLVCASLLFLTLTFFSVFLFPRTNKPPDKRKEMRNWVYIACGFVMVECLALILWYVLVLGGWQSPLAFLRPVYWLETITIVAFGISWLVKGRFLVLDDPGGEGA